MKFIYVFTFVLIFGCVGKVPFDLGNGYKLDYDRNSNYTVFYENGYIINGDILEFNYDSDYVIALVKPVDKIEALINPKNDLNYSQKQRLINSSKVREYWILNKKTRAGAFGPFNKSEFLVKLKELGVSDKLNLINTQELIND
jgi:Protein of unknown function (DUF3997)